MGIKIQKLHRDHRGNVALLVAFAMPVLLGFAALTVDLGAVAVEQQRAQNAVDAGALAGAAQIIHGSTAAAQEAYSIAIQNDATPSYTATADITTNTVTVQGSQTSPLWFARIWGKTSLRFKVSGTAQAGPLVSGTGMVPIGVPSQTFTYGEQVDLTEGAGNGTTGNYGYLSLDSPGGKTLKEQLESGDDGTLEVGQTVSTKSGVNTGPVDQAIQYRLSESAPSDYCDSYKTAESDCPQVLYLPVVSSLGSDSNKEVTIVGFATFYLEQLIDSGGHQQLVGEFIRMIHPGAVGTGTDYGTYGVRLIH